MSDRLVGVRWNTDDGLHVELTDTELICKEEDSFDDTTLLDKIRSALAAGKTVFVIYEPDEYFTTTESSALSYLDIDGLSVLGLGDYDGDLVDVDDHECGLECDYLIVVLEEESGTIEYEEVEGVFKADGSVEFTDLEDDDDDEDDDDEDDDDDDDDDDEDDEDDDEDDDLIG